MADTAAVARMRDAETTAARVAELTAARVAVMPADLAATAAGLADLAAAAAGLADLAAAAVVLADVAAAVATVDSAAADAAAADLAAAATAAAAADSAAVATAVAADTGKNFAAFPGTCGIPQKGPSASAGGPFCCAERERLFSTLPILTGGFFRRQCNQPGGDLAGSVGVSLASGRISHGR
jgi:hypothetical protein